jgi:dTMP kinase
LQSPCLITLEGIEGCGKTVQARRLSRELSRRGISHVLTREPGGTEFGGSLRRILLSDDGIEREPIAELLLYLADRCQHLSRVILPALQRGDWVISDRYHDATLAYQGHARGLGLEKVDALARILDIRMPDVTLWIDLDVRVALERARSRIAGAAAESGLGRFEAETMEFHGRVREGYRLLLERDPCRMIRVDGAGAELEVHRQVIHQLGERGILEVGK